MILWPNGCSHSSVTARKAFVESNGFRASAQLCAEPPMQAWALAPTSINSRQYQQAAHASRLASQQGRQLGSQNNSQLATHPELKSPSDQTGSRQPQLADKESSWPASNPGSSKPSSKPESKPCKRLCTKAAITPASEQPGLLSSQTGSVLPSKQASQPTSNPTSRAASGPASKPVKLAGRSASQ